MTKDEQRAYNRAYYLRRRDELLTRAKEYAERNAAKVAAYQREYRRKNAAKLAAYRKANKDEHRLRGLEWYRENADKKRAYSREWAAQNLARRAKNQRVRSYRKRAAVGHATVAQIDARIAYYGGKCAYCGALATTIDHVIPLARGGTNWPANLRPACHSCNSSKRDKRLADFLRERTLANVC